MIPKKLKMPIYICSFILVIYAVSKVSTSNWAEVEHTSVKIDSLGGDGRDIAAFYKLNQLVEENFLDRDYYEASARSTTSGGRWFANYNKKYQALFLGTIDGWSSFAEKKSEVHQNFEGPSCNIFVPKLFQRIFVSHSSQRAL